MANAPPRAIPVSLQRVAAKPQEVAITYVGHSTYYLDTPEGVRIGTDFNGVYRTGRLPDVVTMNRAHSTHYTLFPDPKIAHVLHGDQDARPPRKLTPAFYGCFDWHSAVHGHWLLARLARWPGRW